MIFHLFIIKPASGTYIFRYVWWFFSLYTLLCYLQWLHYFSTMSEMYTLRETPHEGWSYAKMLKYANDLDVVVTFFHLTWHRWATCCHFYFTKVTWMIGCGDGLIDEDWWSYEDESWQVKWMLIVSWDHSSDALRSLLFYSRIPSGVKKF